jgi:hypothetical protein
LWQVSGWVVRLGNAHFAALQATFGDDRIKRSDGRNFGLDIRLHGESLPDMPARPFNICCGDIQDLWRPPDDADGDKQSPD